MLVRATIASAVLVIAQGLLGAATVEKDLDEGLVAAHLGLAMALLALLLYIVVRASRAADRQSRQDVRRLRPACAGRRRFFVLCTIVAGGYMAGTQNYGRADYQVGDGAHHACGKEFPICNGDFMPFGDARLVDIHLTHRAFMYLATSARDHARRAVAAPAPGRGARFAWLALGVLGAQVLVGALNVWLDEYEALIVLHLGARHAALDERRRPHPPALSGSERRRPSATRAPQAVPRLMASAAPSQVPRHRRRCARSSRTTSR